MSDFEQVPFDADTFAENSEPRCPCVLLLDTSGSMSGAPIAELNAGLSLLRQELQSDSLASKRVEMAVVTFGPVNVVNDFTAVAHFHPPELSASGDTPMGRAILTALKMLKERKARYRANAVPYYRPWVFLITDGAPTDDWASAAEALREGGASKDFIFFAVGVGGADMATLTALSPAGRVPVRLKGLSFRELFAWLSNSLSSVSKSTPGDAVALPSPQGWASVD